MDKNIRQAVEALHASPAMVALVTAGAGSRAIAWLLSVPGASRTVLEAVVPYGSRALIDYLGWQPDQAVSAEAAVGMAAAAHARAVRFREGSGPTLGLACTATIATDRPKRGEHRCHVALWDGEQVTVTSLVLEKGARDRAGEETVVSQLMLYALGVAAGVGGVAVDMRPGEEISITRNDVRRPLERLLDGSVDGLVAYGPHTMVPDGAAEGVAVLSGAFNPLHHGHLALARTAEARLGRPVMFEISVQNVDKPPLTAGQLRARLRQFECGRRVALTREPLFRGKSRLFPGCPFVIGYDTAARLIDPAYYGGSADAMRAALDEIRANGCRFLVAGREEDGVFRTIDDLDVPEGYDDLFEGIPEDVFRADISSTAIREGLEAE
jgi:nicotinamide mononucleotide (NMN) deamidase PncC